MLWVGIGGFLGANARYFMSRAILDRFGTAFPWGTLTVNIIGSFLIGVIMEFLIRRSGLDPAYRLFLVVGVLGGFTTFSSFSYETVVLLDEEKVARAAAYILSSNLLAITACILGIALVRRLA
ncbi:MAG: fluoride efflux transporter CrcB [Thermomicrobiales bacterium]|nr:fluoride efflux transporter CrcB [Thermomicrobiales bacterium]